jgi:hypothetical protein
MTKPRTALGNWLARTMGRSLAGGSRPGHTPVDRPNPTGEQVCNCMPSSPRNHGVSASPCRLSSFGSEVNPDMVESLTELGRNTLIAAVEEARATQNRTVGTEHLLLALTRQDADTKAGLVIHRLGAIPADLRSATLNAVTKVAGSPRTTVGFTPRARLALDLAYRAATRLDAGGTGPEHVLIGLAAEAEGIAARVLQQVGINAKMVENCVAADLDGNIR